ncbi:transketolase [Pelosinus propionicus]|nr:transketolase [Pelosinus propionicus]
MDKQEIQELEKIAAKIRWHTVHSIFSAGSGHPGGALSIADILATLYFDIMKINPLQPKWSERDRLVLSKGHAAPSYYAALALRGYFPVDDMVTLRNFDSYLQGHPDMKKIPGVDMSTGSLGQGLSVANGMALVSKFDGSGFRVFAMLGDGEIEEGQIWEAAMTASHYKLGNLTAFLDCNGLQIDGKVTDVMSPLPLKEKFQAFGWAVTEIDGHSIEAIKNAADWAQTIPEQPKLIICRTIKGKGVSFMENQAGWHGAAPNQEQWQVAQNELNQVLLSLGVKQ